MSFLQNDKLSAVYDAIERESYQEAVKLCQKPALANVPIAQSLMAYSLAAMRKTPESLAICRSIINSKTLDDTVLSTTFQALKICKCEDEIIPAYEHATTAAPGNTNLLRELFFCYLRAQDHKKMQQVSQKLFKNTSQPAYVFWTVSCMMLQPDLPPAFLTLAEKMIAKVLLETAPQNQYQPGAEEMELFILVLKKQNKHEEALEKLNTFLSRPLGPVLNDGVDFEANPGKVKMQKLKGMNMRSELLLHLKDYPNLYLNSLEILKVFPDQWECHLSVMDNFVFNSELSTPMDERINTFLTFVRELQAAHPKLRGPRLAEIHLFLRAVAANNGSMTFWPSSQGHTNVINEVFFLTTAFMEAFSTKQCCFSDLKPILTQVSSNLSESVHKEIFFQIMEWVRPKYDLHIAELMRLHEQLPSVSESESASEQSAAAKKKGGKTAKGKGKKEDSKTPQEALKELVGSFNENPRENLRQAAVVSTCSISKYLQLHTFVNLVLQKEAFPNLISLKDSFAYYLKSKSICEGGIGGEREVQPGDEILLVQSFLFRNSLQNMSEISAQDVCIAWAHLLNTGVAGSPHAFTFRADLLEPLRILGLAEPSLVAFIELGIKHIQVDSLYYLICPTLAECGFFGDFHDKHQTVISFHNSAKRETLDMTSKAFKFSNYMKTLELQRFVDLCKSSLQLALSKSEIPILKVMQSHHNCADAKKYLDDVFQENTSIPFSADILASLQDNCDYSLTVRLDADSAAEENERKVRRRQMENRIIIGQAFAKLIHQSLSLQLFSDVDNSSVIANIQDMASLLVTLMAQQNSNTSAKYLPWSQEISTGSSSVFSNIIEIIQSFSEILTSVATFESSLAKIEENAAKLQAQFSEIESYMSMSLAKHAGTFNYCSVEFIHTLSTFCRFIVPFVPLLCQKLVADARKWKKTNPSNFNSSVFSLVEGVASSISKSIEKIRDAVHTEAGRVESVKVKEALNAVVRPIIVDQGDANVDKTVESFISKVTASQKTSLSGIKSCLVSHLQQLQFVLK